MQCNRILGRLHLRYVTSNLSKAVCTFLHTSVVSRSNLADTNGGDDDEDNNFERKVLHELNWHSQESLEKFRHIGRDKAERLISYRRQHGEFKSLEDLSDVAGFSPAIIRLIRKRGFSERKTRRHVPVLTPEQANNIKSLTSINIGRMEVSWCSLSTDLKMLGWQTEEFKRQKQYQPKSFIENVKGILEQIPRTDIYIVELQNLKSTSRDPSNFPYTLHRRLTEAVIHSVSDIPTFSFDANAVKRHFSLPKAINKQYYSMTVVNDLLAEAQRRFSDIEEESKLDIEEEGLQGGQEMVEKILSNSIKESGLHECLNSLQIEEHFISYFQNKKYKDCLCDSFLQALAFLELEVINRK